MRGILLLLVLLGLTLSGCGIDWFPSTSVSGFAFSPAAETNANGGQSYTSSSVTLSITGSSAVAISVSGDSTSKYSINGGTPTAAEGTVKSGDKVTVQHSAAREAGGVVTTTLQVGSKSASFSTTTASTSTVSAFSFPTFTNVTSNRTKTSSPITVSILGAAARIKISGDTSSKFKINDGAFTNISSTVVNNDKVTVQHNTGTGSLTPVVTTLTIGNRFANFSTITL
jgi:hypothetical protein